MLPSNKNNPNSRQIGLAGTYGSRVPHWGTNAGLVWPEWIRTKATQGQQGPLESAWSNGVRM
ncbi:hypothetical protein HD806DRAFT_486898 [Xylariaceae sp. AK1471]|nr:hypothetical protein HD806DRAFT_486898 [Xylariaceae sp. AK1471]